MRRKKIRFNRKGRKGPVSSKKAQVDGITFQSGLEVYMYRALKKDKLFEKYEEESFELIEGFDFTNPSYERQSNGKGEFKNRNSSKIRKITYTPDFTGKDYIIETKGRANESFPIRYKLFKRLLMKAGDKRALYTPQNQKECDEVIQLIKNGRLK